MNMNVRSHQSSNAQSSRCRHLPELPQPIKASVVSDFADLWISRKMCKYCGAAIVPPNTLMWFELLLCFLWPIFGVGVCFLPRSFFEWRSFSVSLAFFVSVCFAVLTERVIMHRCYAHAPWIAVSQAEIVIKGKRYDVRNKKVERCLSFAALVLGTAVGICLYVTFR